MTILDVIHGLSFPILAYSRLTLAIRILPLWENLLIILVHFANGIAIIVCYKKPALVIFKQFAHNRMLKVVMMNSEIAIRIHALEHFGIFAQIIGRV
jgi:hypothetical protein